MGHCVVCSGGLRPGAVMTPLGLAHKKCQDAALWRASQAYAPEGPVGAPVQVRPAARSLPWIALGVIGAGLAFAGLLTAVSGSKATSIAKPQRDEAAVLTPAADPAVPEPTPTPTTAPSHAPGSSPRPKLAGAAAGPLAPALAPARKPTPAPVAAPLADRNLVCGDGSSSGCSCAGSHRGCCSHHGGVAGCQ